MAFGLRRNQQQGTLGLDVDDRFLAATLVDGRRVLRTASAELPSGIVREGEVVEVEDLASALRAFFKAERLPSDVRLGVANQLTTVRRLEIPRIEDERELDAAVRFQAADAIAMPLDEATLDFQVTDVVESPDGGTPRMQVTVAAARTGMVTKLLDAARKAGLKPQGIDLDAFAIVRMFAPQPTEGVPAVARVYCHLSGVTNLAIAVGPSCVFTRSLTAGWDGPADEVAASLADEIRMSTDYYMGNAGAHAPQELLLSGPGSTLEGLADALGERTGMSTVVAEPLGELDRAEAVGATPERQTVAAGLALGGQA
jgi:type IV pilus assembly protein PilM